jgi:DNA-binding beta-propeller fold protein YncE
MRKALSLFLLGCAQLAAQSPFPQNSTALPDHPWFIKKTWIIGGRGNWDYLTMDPAASRLYIAHGPEVQVVDAETGNLAGQVTGLSEAHSVALDDAGEFGYVSDGPADEVVVFGRRRLNVEAHIPTGPVPRALALDRESGLLVAVCAAQHPAPSPKQPVRSQRPSRRPLVPSSPAPTADEKPKSILAIIDTQTRQELAEILVAGHLGFALADNKGGVYITVEDRNEVAQLDLEVLGAQIRQSRAASTSARTTGAPAAAGQPDKLDWSSNLHPSDNTHLRFLIAGGGCRNPRALAVDGRHLRLFAACDNLKMAVLNTGTGETVTSLPIGPGVEALGYDPGQGLIYSANGGGDGTLTVIRQDVTDSYDVIQTLPTRQQARTLAVNSSTGEVYLVTVLQVAKLGNPPRDGIGTLQTAPQDSSFQVLVVGN